MIDWIKKRQEIKDEIRERGYDSLRYSILNEDTPNEWEVRIDYEEESDTYFVYTTMDRASVMGKYDFEDFELAKGKFFRLLDLSVKRNQDSVRNGMTPEYYSPLWSAPLAIDLDSNTIDAIGIVDGQLELLLLDPNLWLPDTEHDHLLKLQEKINNYIHYLESKQYVAQYGDQFDKKVINITFKYSPSDNGLAFLVQVQKALQATDMSLKVVFPN